MAKVALISGITGQDGALSGRIFIKKRIHCSWPKRRASLFNTDRIDHLYQDPHVENKISFSSLQRPD
ncbi:MAG: GDP-mannose 4,6-dehydratase [Bacteroidales bacterium]